MAKNTVEEFNEGVPYTYFQYFKEEEFPIYLRVNLEDFDPDILGFLAQMKFDELKAEDAIKIIEDLSSTPNSRLLTISEASTSVARQIEMAQEGDKYGPESIIPKAGYGVYRFKNVGMMVYSQNSREWSLGAFPDFGNPNMEVACRSIINRFLAWALSPFGIVSFWGTPVDEGVVVMKQGEASGEAIFFDVLKRRFFSLDGVKKMRRRFKILKLNSTLQGRNTSLTSDELMSFLTVHSTYFDHRGLPTPVRQMIRHLSRECEGLVYPKENFVPRAAQAQEI